MGVKDRRANIRHGRYSRALILPASIEKGEESTLAANRLVLIDPRGKIPEGVLLEFLEEHIEPRFWTWYIEKQKQERTATRLNKKITVTRSKASYNSSLELVGSTDREQAHREKAKESATRYPH